MRAHSGSSFIKLLTHGLLDRDVIESPPSQKMEYTEALQQLYTDKIVKTKVAFASTAVYNLPSRTLFLVVLALATKMPQSGFASCAY